MKRNTKEIKAQELQAGMLLFAQGYIYEVITTQAETLPDGTIRQYSRLDWSQIGDKPPVGFVRDFAHGLKHGEIETILIPPTTEQMQAKYGKNLDTKPHGGNDTYGPCE